jgi:hypothetical protein
MNILLSKEMIKRIPTHFMNGTAGILRDEPQFAEQGINILSRLQAGKNRVAPPCIFGDRTLYYLLHAHDKKNPHIYLTITRSCFILVCAVSPTAYS